MSDTRGLYRQKVGGVELARVRCETGFLVDVGRDEYDELRVQPRFENLPTFDEYRAREKKPTLARH